MKKIGLGLLVMCCLFFSAKAQTENNDTDTLNCPIISFNFAPWVAHGAMNEMFSQPMLDFGVTAIYKTKNNFIFGIEGSFFFGDDNLKNRKERLQSLYTEAGTIIGTGGTDAGVEAYNRGLVGMVQVGKVIPVIKNNPNSGIFLMFGVGIAQNQIIYRKIDRKHGNKYCDYHFYHGISVSSYTGIPVGKSTGTCAGERMNKTVIQRHSQ